jgi:protein phosphatase PTC7
MRAKNLSYTRAAIYSLKSLFERSTNPYIRNNISVLTTTFNDLTKKKSINHDHDSNMRLIMNSSRRYVSSTTKCSSQRKPGREGGGGEENTDPVIAERYLKADYKYAREYNFGRDLINTQEPLKAEVTTITTNSQFANSLYSVNVRTGACRGAGTSGRVQITLIGEDGITYPINMEYQDGDAPGFARGSTLPFRVAVQAHLGPIRRVRARLTPDSTSTGRGWFLEDVSVKCEKTGESYKFQCREWFGPSDHDQEHTYVQPYSRDLELVLEQNETQMAKEREQRMKVRREMGDFVFKVGAATTPHPDKIKEGARAKISRNFGYGGEDAYFIEYDGKNSDTNDNNNNNNNSESSGELGLGVADGVYMWRWEGVDAGLYSRALLRECAKKFLTSNITSSSSEFNGEKPASILKLAYEEVTMNKVKGSTTCVLLTLDPRLGVLNAANIGDSGYLVARLVLNPQEIISNNNNNNNKVIIPSATASDLNNNYNDNNNNNNSKSSKGRFIAHRSPPQEHDFGRPFQLGHHDATDQPSDAMLSSFFLEDDDIIVVGTDGLWDNLSEREILNVIENQFDDETINKEMSGRKKVDLCAKELTKRAFDTANDRSRTTPYSLAATEHFDMVYSGGKKDDITVLVCKVKNNFVKGGV